MALKNKLLLLISLVCSAWFPGESLGQQNLRLELVDLARQDSAGRMVIDSVGLIESDPVFDDRLPVVYYLQNSREGDAVIAFNYETRSKDVVILFKERLKVLRLAPDSAYLTCIRTEADGVSSLIRFSTRGTNITTVVTNFHAENYLWINDNNMITIEPGKPNGLHLVSVRPKRNIALVKHVGKTLARRGKMVSFAFVHKLSVDAWSIKTIQPDGSIAILVETLPEAEIFTLIADGAPVIYHEGELHIYAQSSKTWNQLPVWGLAGEVLNLQSHSTENKLAFLIRK